MPAAALAVPGLEGKETLAFLALFFLLRFGLPAVRSISLNRDVVLCTRASLRLSWG